jgi:hypothetical protein
MTPYRSRDNKVATPEHDLAVHHSYVSNRTFYLTKILFRGTAGWILTGRRNIGQPREK